jgi:mRNA interferase MazF
MMISCNVNRAALQPFRPFVGRMKRGELYLVSDPAGDPKRQRVFVILSHQRLIDSNFSTVVCAPIHSQGLGLPTQVAVGPEDGLKHQSWILCDGLASIPKNQLTRYVGSLSGEKTRKLNYALTVALDLPIEVL